MSKVEISDWGKVSFNGLIKDLNYLKFQCLKCTTTPKEKVHIETEDVTHKFKLAEMTYKVSRGSRKNRKEEML